MKAKDIRFIRISDVCPEQYEAYDADGNQVGYIRIRWGYCIAWCPDEKSDDEVYTAELQNGWGGFGSNKERKRHLRKVKSAIAFWINQRTQ